MKQMMLVLLVVFASVYCNAQQTSVCMVDVSMKYKMTCMSIDNQSYYLIDKTYVDSMMTFAPDLLNSLLNEKKVVVSVDQRLDDTMRPDQSGILVMIGKSIVLHFRSQTCVTGFQNKGYIFGIATIRDGILHVLDCSWISGNQRSIC